MFTIRVVDICVDFSYCYPMWTDRQTIEIFHLLFLRAFGARVDKSLFCLKGGCNLRFFLKSIRHSENVNRLLGAPAFAQSLRAQGIEIARTAQPKQTGTTQRWKLALRIVDSGAEVPTKVEFSRRGLDDEKALESVDAGIIRTYRLYPVIVQHYSVHTAFAQKVSALALRDQVQSRNVFDLKLLYLAPGRSRVFSRLPELSIPCRFQWQRLKEYTELVKSSGRRAYITERIKALRSP